MLYLKKYIGLPFKEFGRDRQGVDCWGLVRLIYMKEWGIELPSYLGEYESAQDEKNLGKLIPTEAQAWQPVELGNEQEGDVIVIRMRGAPMHTAMVTCPKRRTMIHVHEGINTVHVKYNSMEWRNRIIGIFRHHAK